MLDFTDDIIERLLVKKAFSDRKYLGILSNIFDLRWMQDKNISVALDLAVLYYRKYECIPKPSVFGALLTKAIETDRYGMGGPKKGGYRDFYPDCTVMKVQSTLSESQHMDLGVDEEAVNRNVREYVQARALYQSIFDNLKEMEQTKSVDKCLETFARFQKMSFDDQDLGMRYFKKEDQDKHWEYITNPEARLATLWPSLDNYTNGGFYKSGKCLCIFVGQPGLGKSLFLSNLAVNFLRQNKKVVVISCEMSEDVYAQRFDAHISSDDINALRRTSETSRKKIEDFYREYKDSDLVIKEYPPRTVRVADIDDYLTKLRDDGMEFDAVLVDYLNLVLPNMHLDNMYQAVLAVAEQLRALSYKYNCPFISASQVNRNGINSENVGLENISESGGIAHTVDFCGMLYQRDEDQADGIIQMRIAKNRFGGKVGSTIPFQLNPYNLTLTDRVVQSDGTPGMSSEADAILSSLSSDGSDIISSV